MSAYRGKYPNRIKSVSSDRVHIGRALCITNNGNRFYVFAADTGGDIPKCGEDVTRYKRTDMFGVHEADAFASAKAARVTLSSIAAAEPMPKTQTVELRYYIEIAGKPTTHAALKRPAAAVQELRRYWFTTMEDAADFIKRHDTHDATVTFPPRPMMMQVQS